MALDDFAGQESEPSLPEDWHSFESDNLCPRCEEKGEKTPYWYSRCTNDNCSVVTYTYPERNSRL